MILLVVSDINNVMGRRDGIGIHRGLKIPCLNGIVSSSLTGGIKENNMNDKQKVYIKEQKIEITQYFDSFIVNHFHPDGDKRRFYRGDIHIGYIALIHNPIDGAPLHFVDLVNKHYILTNIPMTHFRVLS